MEDPAQDAERDARLTPETASPPENKEDKEVLQSEQPPPMSAPPQAPQPGAPNPTVPWLEQMTTSAQDQQPTSNQQQQPNASSTQLMHPSLPGQYPMPGFGPHTGMQGVPLGNGAYWVGPAGVPQGQIVYAGNAGWFPPSYVPQQQAGGRPPYQPISQHPFYTPQGPITMQQHPYIQLPTSAEGGAAPEASQTAASQANTTSAPASSAANSQRNAGLLGLVMQGIGKPGAAEDTAQCQPIFIYEPGYLMPPSLPGAPQGEAVYPGSHQMTPQQFGAAYLPGQFMQHLPNGAPAAGVYPAGSQPGGVDAAGQVQLPTPNTQELAGVPQGTQGQENMQMLPGSMTQLMGGQGHQMRPPQFWPGMPISQQSLMHGGTVFQIKGNGSMVAQPAGQDPGSSPIDASKEKSGEQPQAIAVPIAEKAIGAMGVGAFTRAPRSQYSPREGQALGNRDLPGPHLGGGQMDVQIIDPGTVKQGDLTVPNGVVISSAEGATGPDGEPLYYQPVRGACSRRRRSQTHIMEESRPSNSNESWSFLPGMTSSGKRRRRHPVAEVKGNWTPEEDAKLVELVKKHGVGNWSKLLPEFNGRIGKQLRERWNHELRPDINKEGWTHEEECGLIEAHKKHGNCWAEIAKLLHGRTQNGIKNHWHATARKVSRAPVHANPSTPLQAYLRALNKKSTGDEYIRPGPLPDSGKARQREVEPVPLQEPATKRPKHAKVANEDFHLRFEQPMEAENPQEQPVATGGRRTQRRLNAEELAVADGLLGLQEASRGQDETDSDDETYPRGARRLAVRPSVAAPQGSARRKRLTRAEGQDPKHRGEEFEEDAPKSGSLSSIIANTAVAVEGLRKVGAAEFNEKMAEALGKAMRSNHMTELRNYILNEQTSDEDSTRLGKELYHMIHRFARLPDLWTLYDVLKQSAGEEDRF